MYYSLHQHLPILLTTGDKNNWESLYLPNKVSETDITGLKVTTTLPILSVDIAPRSKVPTKHYWLAMSKEAWTNNE